MPERLDQKIDRRQQRTRQLLHQSLLERLTTECFDELTVQSVTDQANVGRTTFYLHYAKLEMLLGDVLQQQFAETVAAARSSEDTTQQPGLVALKHVQQHRELYRNVLNSTASTTLTTHLRQFIASVVRKDLQLMLKGRSCNLPVDLITNYVSWSLMGTIIWWLENNEPYTVEQIAAFFHRLVEPGFLEAINTKR